MSSIRKRDLGRYILEKELNRKLTADEIVHHKDGNHYNHVLNNLEILTRAEHIRRHTPMKGYKFTDEQRRHLSEAHKGQISWNKGIYGFKHTSQSKQNMSIAQKGRKITWGDKISQAKIKVSKEEILTYLRFNPHSSLSEVVYAFKLKSHSPIQRHGGLKRLRKEAVL